MSQMEKPIIYFIFADNQRNLGEYFKMSPNELGAQIESAFPIKFNRTQICADNRRNKKDAMRIALSAKRFSLYIRVPKGISYTIKLLKIVTTLKNGGFDHEGKSKKSNGHWD